MGKAAFPLPDDLTETVLLLNATGENFTLVERSEGIRIYTGDQLAFTASSAEEAEAFLAGCFLWAFMGDNLERIRDVLKQGSFLIDSDWPEMIKKRLGHAEG
jgi:hypothetical protein